VIAEHRDTLVRPGNLIGENGSILYGKTLYKTTPVHGRTWYHLYFDPARKDKVIASFMQKLRTLKDELEADKLVESHRTMYERYFTVRETPVRGRSVNDNDQGKNLRDLHLPDHPCTVAKDGGSNRQEETQALV